MPNLPGYDITEICYSHFPTEPAFKGVFVSDDLYPGCCSPSAKQADRYYYNRILSFQRPQPRTLLATLHAGWFGLLSCSVASFLQVYSLYGISI